MWKNWNFSDEMILEAKSNVIHTLDKIDLRKVRGHAGNKWNEIADQLATGKISPEEVTKIYG